LFLPYLALSTLSLQAEAVVLGLVAAAAVRVVIRLQLLVYQQELRTR
jgi:hypothetical protein